MTGAPLRSRWTTERDDRMRAMIDERFTYDEIAAELGGLSRGAVAGRMWRIDLKSKNPIGRNKRAKKAAHHDRGATQRIKAPNRTNRLTAHASDPQQGTMTLVELENCHCRWPVTHGSPYLFCGDPSADMRGGIPYCLGHSHRAGAGYSRDRSYGFNRSANTFR